MVLLVVQGGGADGIELGVREVDEGEAAMGGMVFWKREVQVMIL